MYIKLMSVCVGVYEDTMTILEMHTALFNINVNVKICISVCCVLAL